MSSGLPRTSCVAPSPQFSILRVESFRRARLGVSVVNKKLARWSVLRRPSLPIFLRLKCATFRLGPGLTGRPSQRLRCRSGRPLDFSRQSSVTLPSSLAGCSVTPLPTMALSDCTMISTPVLFLGATPSTSRESTLPSVSLAPLCRTQPWSPSHMHGRNASVYPSFSSTMNMQSTCTFGTRRSSSAVFRQSSCRPLPMLQSPREGRCVISCLMISCSLG